MRVEPISVSSYRNRAHEVACSIIENRMHKAGLTLRECNNLISFRGLVDLEDKIFKQIINRNLLERYSDKNLVRATTYNIRGFSEFA